MFRALRLFLSPIFRLWQQELVVRGAGTAAKPMQLLFAESFGCTFFAERAGNSPGTLFALFLDFSI